MKLLAVVFALEAALFAQTSSQPQLATRPAGPSVNENRIAKEVRHDRREKDAAPRDAVLRQIAGRNRGDDEHRADDRHCDGRDEDVEFMPFVKQGDR